MPVRRPFGECAQLANHIATIWQPQSSNFAIAASRKDRRGFIILFVVLRFLPSVSDVAVCNPHLGQLGVAITCTASHHRLRHRTYSVFTTTSRVTRHHLQIRCHPHQTNASQLADNPLILISHLKEKLSTPNKDLKVADEAASSDVRLSLVVGARVPAFAPPMDGANGRSGVRGKFAAGEAFSPSGHVKPHFEMDGNGDEDFCV